MIVHTNLSPFVMIELNLNDIKAERKILKEAGLSIKTCLGSYKGKVNPSYLVTLDDINDLDVVLKIAKDHNQETVLLVDSNRKADLFYLNNSNIDSLGEFKVISKTDALQLEEFTYDPATNTYWSAS